MADNKFKIKNGLLVEEGGAQITGSLLISGSITSSTPLTASVATSASYATTASYVLNAVSSSFATTASFVATSSWAQNAITASYVLNVGSLSIYRANVSASSTYYVTHSLGDRYPIVQVYNAQNQQQIIPDTVQSVSTNHTYVAFASTFSGSIIVMGSNV